MADQAASATRTRPAAPARRRLFQHPGRVAVVAITAVVVLNLFVVLLDKTDTSSGDAKPLPGNVTAVSPAPGSIAGPVDTVQVDLDDSLTGVLLIKQNGAYVEVPEDQLDRVEGLSQISFRPGPGKEITRFQPGTVDVAVLSWSKTAPTGRPAHPDSYAWSFSVKA